MSGPLNYLGSLTETGYCAERYALFLQPSTFLRGLFPIQSNSFAIVELEGVWLILFKRASKLLHIKMFTFYEMLDIVLKLSC